MDKKTLTVERYCLTHDGDMERHPHGVWCRVADAERAALAIKTAVEAPLLAEVERLTRRNTQLLDENDVLRSDKSEAITRAEKAEADLKAAQEREAGLRGALKEIKDDDTGEWYEQEADRYHLCAKCQDKEFTAREALARPAGEPVEG